MLRNHCGTAWRLFVAFLFLLSFSSTAARGAPLIGLPPVQGGSPPPGNQTPNPYTLSGDVYFDASQSGTMVPGDMGVSGAMVTLVGYNPATNPYQVATVYTAFTNSSGYYTFGNAQQPLYPGYLYTVLETQPTGYTSTQDTVGNFVSATGAPLAGPPGYAGSPSNGSEDPSHPNCIYMITLPSPSGAFAPSGNSVYSAAGYNFGEYRQTPNIGIPPGGGGSGGGTVGTLGANLALVGTNNRFLVGSSLPVTASIKNTASPGASSLNWHAIPLTGALSLTQTAGSNLAAGSATNFPGTINGASLSAGLRSATLLAAQVNSTGQTLGTTTTSVQIDPVNSRGIDSVTPAAFGRIMQGATTALPVSVTSAGAHNLFSNLTMPSGASALTVDSSGNVFSAVNGATVTFNGTTTTNSFVTASATFSTSTLGPTSGTAAVPGTSGLFVGETLAAGTPALPTTLNVPYTADVLQQRQLAPVAPVTVPAAGGGLLYGAVVSLPNAYSVTSTNANPGSNYATSVFVLGSSSGSVLAYSPSGYAVGQVTVSPTLISSGGSLTVPLTVEADALGAISASASLGVTSAEASSVQDTKAYAPVTLSYTIANVGLAATGGSVSSADPAKGQAFGAPLSATFAPGSLLSPSAAGASLTSRVTYIGTAGTLSSYANSTGTGTILSGGTGTGLVNNSNYKGTVGSQCDILASTALATTANTTVTMAWRNRNAVEDGSKASSPTESLPAGVQWLSSDVVDIEGVPNSTTFAMQMSFEDGINSFIEPSGTSSVNNSYVAKLVGTQWETPSQYAPAAPGSIAAIDGQGVNMTLNDFLTTYYNGSNLAALAGSWGVDLSNPNGQGTSWVITNTAGGQFAVVPEPSTFVLLGAAGIVGMFVYRMRRKAGRKSLEA